MSQAQGFQLWEASGEEAEQQLTFGVIEQLVRAAPDSGGPGLADLGNRNGDTRDPIWMGAALVELLGAMQALVFALRRLQARSLSARNTVVPAGFFLLKTFKKGGAPRRGGARRRSTHDSATSRR